MSEKISFNSLKERIPNKYVLTVIAGKRAHKLMHEEYSKDDIENINSSIIETVFNEIIDGTVTVAE